MYTTHIHALKSAAGSIGAGEVSDMAAELEFAAKNNDLEFITKMTQPFLIKLSESIGNIRSYLDSLDDGSAVSGQKADMELLERSLSRLDGALAAIDIDAIEGALAELSAYRWSEALQKKLAEMRDAVNAYDYDAVGRCVAAMRDLRKQGGTPGR